MDKYETNNKCCKTCCYYEVRTHFCRLNPPQPIIFYGDTDESTKVSSKFPVITLPERDYCSHHEIDGNI